MANSFEVGDIVKHKSNDADGSEYKVLAVFEPIEDDGYDFVRTSARGAVAFGRSAYWEVVKPRFEVGGKYKRLRQSQWDAQIQWYEVVSMNDRWVLGYKDNGEPWATPVEDVREYEAVNV